MKMFIQQLIFLIIMKICLSTTSIKTYPTVNLTENVPINTNVIKLISDEEKFNLKLILLNLGGFETNLFEIKNQNIYTINFINREQFLIEKKCFDRSFCLIELHILVNDGQQYWIIPIHIVDENDNIPEFKNSSIELKYFENNFDEYKIPFEGAIDYDEGINNQISYILDCSLIKKEIKLINCFPLFDLIIFSQSLINQYDQLGLKLNSSFLLSNHYKLILHAFNLNKKELINSMMINIKIEKILKKPLFDLNEYKFIIKKEEKHFLGKINAKSNDLTKKLIYKIINKTNNFEINYLTGELYFVNNNFNFNLNEINLLIESSYLINQSIKTFTNIKILIRLLNKLNKLSFNYEFNSLFIEKLNNSNDFIIKQNFSLNEILFNLTILPSYYPSDELIVSLLNFNSIFSFIPSLQLNNYLLNLNNYLENNSIYFLTIEIKHQLTNEYLSNLTIKLITNYSFHTFCYENSIFNLYDLDKINLITKLKVIQTNSNIFSFSKFVYSKINLNEIIINECRMFVDINLNQSKYQLCSLSNQCFNISLINYFQKTFLLKRILTIRPIEIIILTISFIFILLTISFVFIICRLKAFHLCLSIKNYLFYGKKYGLNNAQRLSSNKITQRVHSIIVRESQSPSIEHIKAIEPYMFNINQFLQQETIPSINLYPESSPQISTSSLQRGQRTIPNIDNEIIPQTSSSILQETKQLLDMITSNQDLDSSRLASEV